MDEYIAVKVISLGELFSDAYRFRLPYFQRAYAWRTAEVGRLLTDILGAMGQAPEKNRYLLGNLMLAKEPNKPDTALVDGHQRIMTLTILFAVLRDLENGEETKARLQGFISGSDYRLVPQENLADFCRRFVQEPGATEADPGADRAELSETERNIIDNRDDLRAKLSGPKITPQIRGALADFLADRCCVIASAVRDENEAWRILRIEEETRLQFDATARAKASLLSIVPRGDRIACQRIWEQCEARLGSTDMHALLGHLRTLKLRKSFEKPLEIDIAEGFALDKPGRGRDFMEHELLPACERFAALRHPQFGGRAHREAIKASIDRLCWINSQLWVPAALLWVARKSEDRETALFFSRLERLVWMMRLAGHDPSRQQRRIVQLLGEIDRGVKIEAMRELEIGKSIREAALLNLRSTTFDSKRYCTRVLRRISIALRQDPGPVDIAKVTVEHVLPRSWSAKSGWRHHFPNKNAVEIHAHRLGNLTFLTAAENQAVDTFDWAAKRRVLARSRLVLSNRLRTIKDWTPAVIVNRTEELIRILFEAWDMKP